MVVGRGAGGGGGAYHGRLCKVLYDELKLMAIWRGPLVQAGRAFAARGPTPVQTRGGAPGLEAAAFAPVWGARVHPAPDRP
jgi:hypothetical protein